MTSTSVSRWEMWSRDSTAASVWRTWWRWYFVHVWYWWTISRGEAWKERLFERCSWGFVSPSCARWKSWDASGTTLKKSSRFQLVQISTKSCVSTRTHQWKFTRSTLGSCKFSTIPKLSQHFHLQYSSWSNCSTSGCQYTLWRLLERI